MNFPGSQYRCVLADPPRAFKTYSAKGRGRSPKYATADVPDLYSLAPPTAPDCALFMWTIGTHIPMALDLMKAWGFVFKTYVFIWRKPRIGLGYWSRKEAEICLLGTKGHPKRLSRSVRQVIDAPVREHSRKPDEQYERIERLVEGPRLEMFARQRWPGWDVFGLETDKFEVAA